MGVFVLSDSQGLVGLTPSEFVNEDDFQQLLEKYPALLSGNQADVDKTRRWLLIKREKSIPAEDGGSGRWSVDHLFVDQDGIPTLVEVKRQSDTRLRREVVGQMLDYAANAIVYWPVEQLRAEFEEGCAAIGANPEDEIRDRLAPDCDAETLWQRIKTNLQAGRIRMLFVADRIPAELRRIVEFLNKQMDPVEVLGLELRQFQGDGLRTIVPMLYGQTEKAQQKNPAATVRRNAPFPGDHVVTLLGPCPKTPGKNNYARWMAGYSTGKTVSETIRDGVTMGDIKYDVEHGYVRVDAPGAYEPTAEQIAYR